MSIQERAGTNASVDVYNLYDSWLELRRDMESFLEAKNLPLQYAHGPWTGLCIGVETGSFDYSGNLHTHGFDPGPAQWCGTTLCGMTDEMHHRRHIQRIESYSFIGMMAGIFGIILSIVLHFI